MSLFKWGQEGKVINGIVAKLQLQWGPLHSLGTSTRSDDFIVSKYVVGLDLLYSRQNPHIASLTCGVTAIIGQKSMQILRNHLPLPSKVVNQKKSHPGKYGKTRTTPKIVRVMVPLVFPFSSLVWPLKNPNGSQ